MPHYLAVEWDENEVRFLLGSLKKDRLIVLKTGAAPLEWDEDDTESSGHALDRRGIDAMPTLRVLLKEHRVEKCRGLLVLGRWQIDLYNMTLPGASDEELPGMVKNQVMREATTLSEVDPVDFLAIDPPDSETRRVIAATISAGWRQRYAASFRSIGHPLSKIAYRGVAAAELLVRTPHAPGPGETLLVTTIAGKEVELTTLGAHGILAFRSFKIPEGAAESEADERIAAEIIRTLAVALPEQFGEVRNPKVLLYAAEGEKAELLDQLVQHGFDVETLNPFAIEGVVCRDIPENPERYAGLLGAVRSALPERKPALDLLSPKEKPKPPNIARWVVLAILLLGVAGFGLHQWNAMLLAEMTTKAEKLETDVDELTKAVYGDAATNLPGVANPAQDLYRTQVWDGSGANWLDELRDISIHFPVAEDLVISRITFVSGPINNNPNLTGSIQLQGMVRDPLVLRRLQWQLAQGRYHKMLDPVPTRNPAGGGYPWLFNATILVARRAGPSTYLNALPRNDVP